MNLFGHGIEVMFIVGIALGFFMAIIPGPGITQVLNYAFKGHKEQAWKAAGGVLLGDMIIILICLLSFSWISTLSNNPWVRFSGGIFLLGFAIFSFFSKKKIKDQTSRSPFRLNFRITLLNPNIWASLIGVAALAFQSLQSGIVFLLGIELGCLAWLTIVIHYASRLPSKSQALIHRGAMFFIAIMGIYVMTDAIITQIHI